MNPYKLAKWDSWLGEPNSAGSISSELTNLALIRMIHEELRQMVSNNTDLQKPSAFYLVIQMTYSQSALMYIRRQVRKDSESRNLIMLADDISQNCDMITKGFYSGLYAQVGPDEERETWTRLGEEEFSKKFEGPDGNSLDPQIIQEDLNNLKAVHDNSKGFIDRRLAHLDKREPTCIPKYSDIESWCDILNKIFKKYVLLLRAVDYKIETVLQHDWKSIFRTAWLQDE